MAKKKFKKRSSKYQLIELDTLRKERDAEDGSGTKWKGDAGSYFFKHIDRDPVSQQEKPVAHIFKNHKYFTGIFPSLRSDLFSGDIRHADGTKIRLVFKVIEKGFMKIYMKRLKDEVAK